MYGAAGLLGGYLLSKYLSPPNVSAAVNGAIGANKWECACADGTTKYCTGGNCGCCVGSGIPISYRQHTPNNYLSVPASLRKTVGVL